MPHGDLMFWFTKVHFSARTLDDQHDSLDSLALLADHVRSNRTGGSDEKVSIGQLEELDNDIFG